MRTRKTLGGGLSIGETADAHAVVSMCSNQTASPSRAGNSALRRL